MKSLFKVEMFNGEVEDIVADGMMVGGQNGVLMAVNEKTVGDAATGFQTAPDVVRMISANQWCDVVKVGPYIGPVGGEGALAPGGEQATNTEALAPESEQAGKAAA